MSENDSTGGEPQSPCSRQCCLDADDICVGCYRSIQEICRWGQAPKHEKLTIVENARRRKMIATSSRR